MFLLLLITCFVSRFSSILLQRMVVNDPDSNELTSKEMADAANLDDGVYSTMTFPYINDQFEMKRNDEVCYDNHLKCLASMHSAPAPICAWNNNWRGGRSQFTFPSYCDLYFDNCRRGVRHWRGLGTGICTYPWSFWHLLHWLFTIEPY